MKKISLFLACALVVACGDDDRPSDDPTTIPSDLGPRPDTGPGPDLGPPVDMGPSGPDMGPGMSMCPEGVCDLVTNAGCEAGQGCYFAAEMEGDPPAPLCAPAGTLADGASCGNANDCQEGFICVGDPGVCRRICCGDNDADCDPSTTGQLCLINIVDADGEPTGVGACQLPDDCDPIAQTGCESPEACFPSGDGAFSCTTPGDGTQGSVCDDAQCAAGFLCIMQPDDMPSICAQVCDTADPVCDADGTSCGGLTGYDDIGVCVSG